MLARDRIKDHLVADGHNAARLKPLLGSARIRGRTHLALRIIAMSDSGIKRNRDCVDNAFQRYNSLEKEVAKKMSRWPDRKSLSWRLSVFLNMWEELASVAICRVNFLDGDGSIEEEQEINCETDAEQLSVRETSVIP